MSFTPLEFRGNVSELFYVMQTVGAETVPVSFADTTVTIGYADATPSGQVIDSPEQWVEWLPLGGSVAIAFADGTPVRSIWVLTNQAEASPPVIAVWASAAVMDLYKEPQPPSTPTLAGFFKQLVGSNCGVEVGDAATFRVDTASGAQFTQSGNTTLELDQTASYLQNNNAQVFVEGATNFLVDSGAQVLFTNSALVQCSTDGNAGSGPAVVVGGTSGTRLTVDGGTLFVDLSFDEFAVGNASGDGVLVVNGTLNLGQPSTNTNAGQLLVAGSGGDGNANLTIATGATLNVYTSIASGVFESIFRLVGNLVITGATVTVQDAQVASLAGSVLANYTYVPTGLSVAFTDTSYSDGSGGSVTSWSWNFGDSGSSTAQNPTHVYASPGTYTVVLTATTSGAKVSTCTRKVTVT